MSESSENKQNEVRKELVLDEFLVTTIVSLRSTLASMEKDADQKTDLLHDLADSMTAVAYNMKQLKERTDRNDIDHEHIVNSVDEMRSRLDLVEAKFDSENTQITGHVKEIKYAVQQFEKLLIELKSVNKQPDAEKKKSDFSLENIWEAIKNVRMIFIILLVLAIIFTVLVGGQGAISGILTALKGLLG